MWLDLCFKKGTEVPRKCQQGWRFIDDGLYVAVEICDKNYNISNGYKIIKLELWRDWISIICSF